jgi:hypothetical protein
MTAENAIAPHQSATHSKRGYSGSPSPDSIFVTVNSAASYTFKNLKLRHSCEALMPGKKPTVRLMFYLADPRGSPAFSEVPHVSGVISEEFLVTTCRAKGRGDGGSLLYNTKVSYLPGVGQETERKLANLADSCPPLAAAQLVRPDSIATVCALSRCLSLPSQTATFCTCSVALSQERRATQTAHPEGCAPAPKANGIDAGGGLGQADACHRG